MPAKGLLMHSSELGPTKGTAETIPSGGPPACQMKSQSQSSGLSLCRAVAAGGFRRRLHRTAGPARCLPPAVASTCRDQLKPAAEVLWYVSAWERQSLVENRTEPAPRLAGHSSDCDLSEPDLAW
jgi:hypothetical protein